MNALVVYVLGPSGAGKDSLQAWLLRHWPGPASLRQARRTITRAADAGGEAHEALSPQAFAAARARGDFVLHWEAHGLCYGVRRQEVLDSEAGSVVLVNGSRAHLDDALQQFPRLAVLHVTASPHVLRARLLARQRETPEQVEARLQRNPALPAVHHPQSLTVTNDGTLDAAGQQALNWLLALASPPCRQDTRVHAVS